MPGLLWFGPQTPLNTGPILTFCLTYATLLTVSHTPLFFLYLISTCSLFWARTYFVLLRLNHCTLSPWDSSSPLHTPPIILIHWHTAGHTRKDFWCTPRTLSRHFPFRPLVYPPTTPPHHTAAATTYRPEQVNILHRAYYCHHTLLSFMGRISDRTFPAGGHDCYLFFPLVPSFWDLPAPPPNRLHQWTLLSGQHQIIRHSFLSPSSPL